MTSRLLSVGSFNLVVFGGTGDLACRKLYPALFHRFLEGQFSSDTRIIGASRQRLTLKDFTSLVAKALESHAPDEASYSVLEKFLATLRYAHVDARKDLGWDDLRELLGDDPSRVRAFYLATAPELFGPISNNLSLHGMITPASRVIVEKPVGKDSASAAAINDAIGAVFQENQIFRIDHYLGKETVQNLMALRFANALLEPLWSRDHIDHVQITVAEKIGVETRGAYYDGSGALRDMIQNHILQLLCLVAMEPPTSLAADDVRDAKSKVLKSLVPIDESNVAHLTVRGQYRSGAIEGVTVANYLHDIDKSASDTETFVALKVNIGNWRWAGVPFYLRTGKRLPDRVSEIVVAFKEIPHSIFDSSHGKISQTRLVIRLQPDEGVKLWLMIKEPGPGGMRLRRVPLDMSFAKVFGVRSPEAYERLLMDVIRGNATLFMRRDEVEAAWEWIDPIRQAWTAMHEQPRAYAAGTWGPSAAIALIERDGRTWYEETE
jgi:glucose-6-phosphate 1-dehydrogenase